MAELSFHLNATQMDAIKEITNIGAGNAATALADILTDRVNMSVPMLQFTHISNIADILGGPENEVVGVLVGMTNDLDGMLMFLFDKRITVTLLRVLLGKDVQSFESIDEMDMSALKEIGNIIAGAYVAALATITDLDVRLSPPDIAIDMVGAILSYPAALFGAMGDQVLFIKEDFDSGEDQVTCHLLLMPQPEALDLIMKRLGV